MSDDGGGGGGCDSGGGGGDYDSGGCDAGGASHHSDGVRCDDGGTSVRNSNCDKGSEWTGHHNTGTDWTGHDNDATVWPGLHDNGTGHRYDHSFRQSSSNYKGRNNVGRPTNRRSSNMYGRIVLCVCVALFVTMLVTFFIATRN